MKRWPLLLFIPVFLVGYVLIRVYWPFEIYNCEQSHKFIFMGDSITRGTVGDSYLNYLEIDNYCNTSKNGQTLEGVYQTLMKLDLRAEQKIVLMIGGNDARLEVSIDSFSQYLKKFIEHIQRKQAQLLIVAPPLINDDVNNSINQRLQQINLTSKMIANEMGIPFVDVGPIGVIPQGKIENLMHLHPSFINAFQRYVLFRDWDAIAKQHEMNEYVDRYHLSNTGARILASKLKKNSVYFFQ